MEFDNIDLAKIIGLKTSQFAEALGYQSSFNEVCHRDNVILTVPPPSPPMRAADSPDLAPGYPSPSDKPKVIQFTQSKGNDGGAGEDA